MSADSPLRETRDFFDFYNKHDVDGMLSLFAENAVIDYLPASIVGKASKEGREVWLSLIEAFPDLRVQITNQILSVDGKVTVFEVTIQGSQAKDVLGIKSLGKSFVLPHVFISTFDNHQKIVEMKAYWDNAKLIKDLSQAG